MYYTEVPILADFVHILLYIKESRLTYTIQGGTLQTGNVHIVIHWLVIHACRADVFYMQTNGVSKLWIHVTVHVYCTRLCLRSCYPKCHATQKSHVAIVLAFKINEEYESWFRLCLAARGSISTCSLSSTKLVSSLDSGAFGLRSLWVPAGLSHNMCDNARANHIHTHSWSLSQCLLWLLYITQSGPLP